MGSGGAGEPAETLLLLLLLQLHYQRATRLAACNVKVDANGRSSLSPRRSPCPLAAPFRGPASLFRCSSLTCVVDNPGLLRCGARGAVVPNQTSEQPPILLLAPAPAPCACTRLDYSKPSRRLGRVRRGAMATFEATSVKHRLPVATGGSEK